MNETNTCAKNILPSYTSFTRHSHEFFLMELQFYFLLMKLFIHTFYNHQDKDKCKIKTFCCDVCRNFKP